MTPPADEELARRVLAVLSAGDTEGFGKLVDDEIEMELRVAERSDIGELALPIERHALPALGLARAHRVLELRAGAAKEREGRAEIFGREPRLLGEALRRQIIEIAVGRDLLDLDQALAHAALQIRVGETQRDAEFARDRSLRQLRVLLDRIEDTEGLFTRIAAAGVAPLAVGGDHSISFPILKALGAERPVGLVHIDAHCDTGGPFEGAKFHHGAARFLTGTPNVPAHYAATAGYDLIEEIGVGRIRENSLRQTQLLIDLADGAGFEIRSPRGAERRGGTVTVHVPEFPAVHRELGERGVICDFRPDAGIRLGPHFFTSDEELETAIGEIADIVATGAYERHLGAVARH